jgi:hypothetical protein
MPRVAVTIMILGFVGALFHVARADECFCVIHSSSGAILRGCEAFKAPTDFYSTAVCTDPETGKRSEQTMYSDWKRIEAGADRCNPCKPISRGTSRELPRGGPGATPSAPQ